MALASVITFPTKKLPAKNAKRREKEILTFRVFRVFRGQIPPI